MTCAGARRKLEAYLQLAGSLAERLVYVYIDEGTSSSLYHDAIACLTYSDRFLNILIIFPIITNYLIHDLLYAHLHQARQ